MADTKEKLRRDVAQVNQFASDNMHKMNCTDYVAIKQVCAALSDVLNATATPPADAALADDFQEWIADKITILEERARHHHRQGAYDVVKSIRNDHKMFDAIAAALRAWVVPDGIIGVDETFIYDPGRQMYTPLVRVYFEPGKDVAQTWVARDVFAKQVRAMFAASKEVK